MEITFTLSVGSVILGFLLGFGVCMLAFWLAERDLNRDDRWHVGFSQGWHSGWDSRKKLDEELDQKESNE